MLSGRVYLIDEPGGVPYREIKVGRVYIYEQDETLIVHLHRKLVYTFTSDMIYSEFRRKHRYSSWPLLYDALEILRLDMVLDDLAGA